MAKTSRVLQNAAAKAEAEAKAAADAAVQDAINSVITDNLRLWTGAVDARTEAEARFKEAQIGVGIAKLDAFANVAKASFEGAWTQAQIDIGINSAMLVWAGNETRVNPRTGIEETPDMRLKSKTADRMRSEFAIPMREDIRKDVGLIILRAREAWDAEGVDFAKDNKAETPLRDAYYNRFAEMALAHLRDAKSETKMVGPRGAKVPVTVPGTLYADRAAMVAAAKAKPVRGARPPAGDKSETPEVVHAVPPDSAEAADTQIASILAAIDALGEAWNATELLAEAREAFRKVASGAVLAKRKAGVVLAPSGAEAAAKVDAERKAAAAARAAEVAAAKAAADAKAAEPVQGAAELDAALVASVTAAVMAALKTNGK